MKRFIFSSIKYISGGAAWWRRLPVESLREYMKQGDEYYYTNMPKFTATYY